MIRVTKEEFYKIIYSNNLDVHPHPDFIRDSKTGACLGMYDIWTFRNRTTFGKTIDWHKSRKPPEYHIEENFYEKLTK